MLAFLLIEKIFEFTEEMKPQGDRKGIKILGILNLVANCIDNFLHGLTVASRLVCFIYYVIQCPVCKVSQVKDRRSLKPVVSI